MEISSAFVGSTLKDYDTEVRWRDTMNYAASIGDNNSHYFNDEHRQGIIAPPLYSVALTWPVSEKIWDYIEAPDFPNEMIATQVHYTEHLSFHRPVRPGDRLKIRGRIAAILPHRAGAHIIIRFDAVDRGDEPVFTEHIGALMRGVRCTDEGRGGEDIPKIPGFPGTNAPAWETAIPIDPLQPFVYDGCTNIVFPIHTSVSFAHAVGLPGIILQGTATLAYALRDIINKEADGDPYSLKSVYCRFTGMVLPGTTIRVRLMHRDNSANGTDLFFVVLNAEDKKVISGGHARLETQL